MTLQQPMDLTALCYTTAEDRQALAALVCGEGIVAAGDLEVTTGGSGLDLFVAAGGAYVAGTQDSPDQGMYRVRNNSQDTVTVDDADPSDPRIDQLIVQVRDSDYGGLDDDAIFTVLAGTPTTGADLSNLDGAATLPDDSLRLAYVLVPAGFTGPFVDATHILDVREQFQVCGLVDVWHEVGAVGEPDFDGSPDWQNYGVAHRDLRFRKEGSDVVRIEGAIKGAVAGPSGLVFTLPAGYRPAVRVPATVVDANAVFARVIVETDGTVTLGGGSAVITEINFTFTTS